METERRNVCLLCNNSGQHLYSGLRDQLFSAPGEWSFSACSGCGLLWLDPYPSPKELGKMYETYYTHEGNRRKPLAKLFHKLTSDVYSTLGYNQKKQRTLGGSIPIFKHYAGMSILKIPSAWGARLLDVGSGNGEFLNRMKQLGWYVEGTEFDPKAATIGRERYGLKIWVGDLVGLQLPENSFDVITLNHVIEHSLDPEGLLRECRRLLAPGGRIVLLTPNAESLGHRLFRQYWRGLETPRHLVIFSVGNFGLMADKVGLKTEVLTSSARIARYLYSTSMHIKQGRFEIGTGGKRGYYLAFKSYVFQAIEELYKIVDSKAGEEIFFVGKK